MASYHNKQIVKYTTVFQKEPGDVMDLLRHIDKSTAVKIVARMNHLARTKLTATVDDVLNMWFGSSNVHFRAFARHHIFVGYGSLGVSISELTIISVWTNLNILDLLLSEPENAFPKKSGDESERDFFKVYLAINETFANGSNELVTSLQPQEEKGISWYARIMLGTLIKYHDFANTTPKEILAAQIIKAYYCFQFLESTGHKELIQMFLQSYVVDSWQMYFKLILPLCTGPITNADGSGLYYFQLQDTVKYHQRSHFIRQLALNGNQTYSVAPDFLHIRSRPLYETEPNRFLVCDTVLNLNRVHNSMFFELKNLATNNQHLHPRYDNFFSFYTTEYTEHFLAYTLLGNMYAKSNFYRLTGEEIKTKFNVFQEPDYYVRDGRKIFLFEVKGSMLTGESKQSFDYEIIEAELRKKYFKKPGSKKNIGIMQLLDRAALLLSETKPVAYDTDADQKNLEIYPILLTTERALNTPGMNQLFNEWFRQALNEDIRLSGKLYQIHELTIVDMDTLINFSEMFINRPTFLEETIQAYNRYIKFKTPSATNKQPLDQLKKNMNQAMQSYADFLGDNYKPPTPELFMKIGREVASAK